MRTWSCCVIACLSFGCIVPRSMVVGQMAAPVGRGATDIGVFTGVQYGQQTNPAFDAQDSVGNPIKTTERTAGFSLPAFEANLQYGFNENVGLNVHASSAGIQPGVKFTVNRSKVAHFAILPQVAVGYASLGGNTGVAGNDGVVVETSPTVRNTFTFLGGLKLLVSHKSGFFAGVGYDFMFNRQYSAAINGGGNASDRSEAATSTISHQIGVGIGMDIALGWVHLRPEVNFAVYPGISQTRTARVPPNETLVGASGGFGWAIFPGFTLAVQTPRRQMTAEEEEEEAERAAEEARQKRRRDGDDDDTDEDEDGNLYSDDEFRKPKLKNKRQIDDDEEEENPVKKRKPIPNDDED